MFFRRLAVTVTVVAGLAACGGDDDADVALSVAPAPTTTIDLADGALISNEGGTLDEDDASITTEAADTTEAGTVADASAQDADAGAPTTLAADATTDPTVASTAPSDAGSDGGGGDGTTDGAGGGTASDGGTTGGATSGSGGTGAAAIEPGEGLIVINDVSYPFDIAFCEFESDVIEIEGGGIASDGAGFEAGIFYEGTDIDGDGVVDSVLEVSVRIDVPTGADGDSVPEFSVFDITTSASGSDSALTFEIAGSRITGRGTIEDNNEVAFPQDQPGALTFDAICV